MLEDMGLMRYAFLPSSIQTGTVPNLMVVHVYCRRLAHMCADRAGSCVCMGHLQGYHWCVWLLTPHQDCASAHSGLGAQDVQ